MLFPLVSATAGGFVCIIGFISLVVVLGLVLGLLTVGSSASCSEGAVAFGLLCVSSWSSSPVRVVCCGCEPDLISPGVVLVGSEVGSRLPRPLPIGGVIPNLLAR